MTTWQQGVGIYHTSPLLCSDIGNVRDPASRRGPGYRYCAPGTEGRINNGLAEYQGDPYTATGQLDPAEIRYLYEPSDPGQAPYYKGIAPIMRVKVRTVRHWFGLDPELRNCVPVSEQNKRICNMMRRANAAPSDKARQLILSNRRRCFMACGLVVDGGLQRVPIWTRGDAANGGLPFELRHWFAHIDEAVADVEDTYDGNLDAIGELPISKAWCQITIEPSETGKGWDAVYLYHHQNLGEPSEEILPADD